MANKKCTVCGKGFKNLPAHMRKHEIHGETLSQHNIVTPSSKEDIERQGLPQSGIRPATMEEAAQVDPLQNTLLSMQRVLESMMTNQQDLNKRLIRIETGDKFAFKEDMKQEDVARAKDVRVGVTDPRILSIVDELLGEDFGVRIEANKDKPGFMFTIVVPQRLSPLPLSQRPMRKENPKSPRDYVRDEKGALMLEDYYPEDLRSRAIASTDSYDAIRNHCQKVQAHIVAYHQKMNKPIPEFRIKTNV